MRAWWDDTPHTRDKIEDLEDASGSTSEMTREIDEEEGDGRRERWIREMWE